MNFTYRIFPDQRTIVARYIGSFTLSELMQTARQLWSDPQYSRSFDGLVDVSAASTSVAVEDLRAFLHFIRGAHQVSEGRWAAVATTPLATACSFLYRRAMAGHHTTEVFSTWEAACDFLNFGRAPDTPPLPKDPRALLE